MPADKTFQFTVATAPFLIIDDPRSPDEMTSAVRRRRVFTPVHQRLRRQVFPFRGVSNSKTTRVSVGLTARQCRLRRRPQYEILNSLPLPSGPVRAPNPASRCGNSRSKSPCGVGKVASTVSMLRFAEQVILRHTTRRRLDQLRAPELAARFAGDDRIAAPPVPRSKYFVACRRPVR